MGKGRFTALDIASSISELRKRLLGTRLANVYDLNPKTFLWKFGRAEDKLLLLTESGVRIHSTVYAREKAEMPNGFCMKLRKHVRTKMLHDICQVNMDRVVMMTFGQMENAFHVIIEMYAAGNIILTDSTFRILSLLRNYELSDEVKVAVGEIYPVVHKNDLFAELKKPELMELWKAGVENPKCKTVSDLFPMGSIYLPNLVEHCFVNSGLKNNVRALWDGTGDFVNIDLVLKVLNSSAILLKDAIDNPKPAYLMIKEPKENETDSKVVYSEFTPLLLNVHLNSKYSTFPTFNEALDEYFTKMETFSETAKISAMEAAALFKVERIRTDHANKLADLSTICETSQQKAFVLQYHSDFVDDILNAVRGALGSGMDWHALSVMIREQKKIGNAIACAIHSLRFDQNVIVVSLPNVLPDEAVYEPEELKYQMEQEEKRLEEETIPDSSEDIKASENNAAEEVDALENYNEKEERSKQKIEKRKKQKADRKGLNKKDNSVKQRPTHLVIELDLNLSSFKNAEVYYSQKKKSEAKGSRTIAASEKALKKAEKTMKREVIAIDQHARIKQMRKVFWFEKFHWFITSENYLVIGGKDAQQNEALVKRYLKKNDVYLHADLHGASSVIIKNPLIPPENISKPIPPLSLSQAALMTVARSAAWDSKMLISAYWVHANQVSKSAPSGEFLPTGSFMVRGKRNPIPIQPLIMGVAILFALDATCIASHLGERRVRGQEEVEIAADDESDDDGDELQVDNEESNLKESASSEVKPAIVSQNPITDSEIENFGVSVSTLVLTKTVSNILAPVVTTPVWNPNEEIVDEPVVTTHGKRLSAAEKRKNKKLADQSQPISNTEQSEQISSISTETSTKSTAAPKPSVPSVKLSKTKLKKLKKYKDQDDEEREIRGKLLGTIKESSVSEDEKNDDDAEEKSAVAVDLSLKSCFLCHEKGHVASNCPMKPPEMSTSDAIYEAKAKEEADLAAIMAEENIGVSDDKNEELSALTGKPLVTDLIHFAIPMCAPYSALAEYKYKAKILPGTSKRGQVTKAALGLFTQHELINPRELELIKAIPDAEVSQVLLNNMKIVIGGSSKSKGKKSHGKKGKR